MVFYKGSWETGQPTLLACGKWSPSFQVPGSKFMALTWLNVNLPSAWWRRKRLG